MKTSVDGAGYATFRFVKQIDGKNVRENLRVHRLVASYFMEPSDLATVNHKDMNKRNNHVDNLEWMSLKENIRHALARGRYDGTNNPNRAKKLTSEKVRAIREAADNGIQRKLLARQFGVSGSELLGLGRPGFLRLDF